ncbi:Uma2 family endonuclease [Leptolyngbya cf. ectocarpi LEGE 11479]|uniref:Uma2 family endonuclease n=1 Tax=Leptolyngbya cf. ectocarpi LEGE 11479 TaxID=1828722 RepID=A0A928ZU13_LEPEC|nr:Uma2 family endonuclease [Leptolyngbya ectocarpi]MBE9067443.1 Uma2 family endonuclease [Leptolyngbya cf. ectocarpi LEGE 11479]
MVVTMAISKLHLEPGSHVTIPEVSWQDFESILQELGENRGSRVAYSRKILEIMVPLPDHERSKILISDIVKVLLRHQNRDWESLGSTTFRRQTAGVEPDDCFYIANYQAVIGKNRLDLVSDPPPDLAIESDYTSKTKLEAYLTLQVPELWIYDRTLKIYVLSANSYLDTDASPTFPGLPIKAMVADVLDQAQKVGSSRALRAFEASL